MEQVGLRGRKQEREREGDRESMRVNERERVGKGDREGEMGKTEKQSNMGVLGFRDAQKQ